MLRDLPSSSAHTRFGLLLPLPQCILLRHHCDSAPPTAPLHGAGGQRVQKQGHGVAWAEKTSSAFVAVILCLCCGRLGPNGTVRLAHAGRLLDRRVLDACSPTEPKQGLWFVDKDATSCWNSPRNAAAAAVVVDLRGSASAAGCHSAPSFISCTPFWGGGCCSRCDGRFCPLCTEPSPPLAPLFWRLLCLCRLTARLGKSVLRASALTHRFSHRICSGLLGPCESFVALRGLLWEKNPHSTTAACRMYRGQDSRRGSRSGRGAARNLVAPLAPPTRRKRACSLRPVTIPIARARLWDSQRGWMGRGWVREGHVGQAAAKEDPTGPRWPRAGERDGPWIGACFAE
ncbi:hypothetical protein BD289DRAFT_132871 [Coniella lustricola]|uniref:Uncharacterized protein n=1 Tax=Coniella lustricola TaxID=2025994 RepID=A0A2T2ZVW7_9PEZI|nr:hypothetical protein BD289DRAFT_132871 [Coniella lustricola]